MSRNQVVTYKGSGKDHLARSSSSYGNVGVSSKIYSTDNLAKLSSTLVFIPANASSNVYSATPSSNATPSNATSSSNTSTISASSNTDTNTSTLVSSTPAISTAPTSSTSVSSTPTSSTSVSSTTLTNCCNTNNQPQLQPTLSVGNIRLYLTTKSRFKQLASLGNVKFSVRVTFNIAGSTISFTGTVIYDTSVSLYYIDLDISSNNDYAELFIQHFLSGFQQNLEQDVVKWKDAIISDIDGTSLLFISKIDRSEELSTFLNSIGVQATDYNFSPTHDDNSNQSSSLLSTLGGDVNSILSSLLNVPVIQKHIDKQQKDQEKEKQRIAKLTAKLDIEKQKLADKQKKEQEKLIKKNTKLLGGGASNNSPLSFSASSGFGNNSADSSPTSSPSIYNTGTLTPGTQFSLNIPASTLNLSSNVV